MKMQIELDIEPFSVPKFVRTKHSLDGNAGDESQPISLKKLDVGVLDKLCAQFRHDVFRHAGKTPPVIDAEAT